MENGNVLFVRNDDDEDSSENENVWDDSVLIKAYDRAVSAAKAQLVPHSSPQKMDETGDKAPTRKILRRESNMRSKKVEWQVGTYCRSVYSEDGKIYEAIIQSVNPEEGVCTVKYIGYENEEEVLLNTLMPSEGQEARTQQEIQALCYVTEEELEIDSKEAKTSKQNSKATFSKKNEKNTRERIQFSSQFPPQYWPHVGSQFSQSSHTMLPPMFVPPPPPLNLTSGLPVEDSDALSAMLMSWYMSGFHTGYYQGLQQSKATSNTLRQNT